MKAFWTVACFVVYAVNSDFSGPHVLALASSYPPDNPESLPSDGVPPNMLEDLLWFFRSEDSSPWNYSILGLSFLVLVIGIVLLGANIKSNRARKVALLHKGGYEASPPEEAEMKQAFVLLKDDSLPDPQDDSLHPKTLNTGQVTIQWKDGNVTTLYEEKTEEDI